MTTPKRPKCRSKQIPCPAGDRCPQHRGRAQAILEAIKNSDTETAALLKKEELDEKEKVKLQKFLDEMKIKLKKDGSAVITLTEQQKILEKNTLSGSFYISKDVKKKIVAEAVHPADAVDKKRRIVPHSLVSATHRQTLDEALQTSVDELYDGNVTFSTKIFAVNMIGIDKLDISDDYKGHGVESHVLASIVVDRRPDLYNFVSKADLPHSEYEKAGFEPNPYYWAGQTHPETGHSYPDVETLDKLYNARKHPNHWNARWMNLYSAKSAQDYPYIRMGTGYRFSEVPLNKTPMTPEELSSVRDKQAERWSRTERGRSVWNELDLH